MKNLLIIDTYHCIRKKTRDTQG